MVTGSDIAIVERPELREVFAMFTLGACVTGDVIDSACAFLVTLLTFVLGANASVEVSNLEVEFFITVSSLSGSGAALSGGP